MGAAGKTFTVLKAFNNVWSIIEDKKGNIWTTGGVTLSRYDQKSLYNKKPAVTEIISEPPALGGFWKLTMEVYGLEV
jgi:hypothetical protein